MESQKNSSINDAAQATQDDKSSDVSTSADIKEVDGQTEDQSQAGVAESALKKTSDAAHYVQDKVSDAAHAIADTVRSAVNPDSDAAASTGTKASDTAVQAKDTSSGAVAVAAMTIRETYDAVKNSVTGTGFD